MYRKSLSLVLLTIAAALILALPVFGQYDDVAYTLKLGGNDELGAFLVGANDMTLYLFERDPLGESVCVDQCAANWPPYTVESAEGLTVEEGIPGEVGTIERADGTLQATYNDIPLYFWVNDAAPGDATGHNVNDVWFVVPPATVYVGGSEDLGPFLVGPNGMTLYLFTNDEPGVSNCVDDCAAVWPPLTVERPRDLVAGVNLPGELGTIERADGTLQVTYNDIPLYFWVNDAARGDTTGQGVGDVWFVVAPE